MPQELELLDSDNDPPTRKDVEDGKKLQRKKTFRELTGKLAVKIKQSKDLAVEAVYHHRQLCSDSTENAKKLYLRNEDYWEFWDETIWNPGPCKNRNKNNLLVALVSSLISGLYVAVLLLLRYMDLLRFVQDEVNFRTVAKFNFDHFYIHYLNILSCSGLAIGTFYFAGVTQRWMVLVWIIFRPLIWLNSARNFRLFLHRPHAYTVVSSQNPEWRWQYLSAHLSFWFTVLYWAFHVISWVYEWTVVVVFYYFISVKSPLTTAVVPAPMHRINDSALTVPCSPDKDYVLLCPMTPAGWKNPNKSSKKESGPSKKDDGGPFKKEGSSHPPLSIKTDNRIKRT